MRRRRFIRRGTQPAVTVPTMSINEEKNGVEIRFPDKPDTETLARLHNGGWAFSWANMCWYKKRSAAAEAFAASIVGASPAASGLNPAVPTPARTPAVPILSSSDNDEIVARLLAQLTA